MQENNNLKKLLIEMIEFLRSKGVKWRTISDKFEIIDNRGIIISDGGIMENKKPWSDKDIWKFKKMISGELECDSNLICKLYFLSLYIKDEYNIDFLSKNKCSEAIRDKAYSYMSESLEQYFKTTGEQTINLAKRLRKAFTFGIENIHKKRIKGKEYWYITYRKKGMKNPTSKNIDRCDFICENCIGRIFGVEKLYTPENWKKLNELENMMKEGRMELSKIQELHQNNSESLKKEENNRTIS